MEILDYKKEVYIFRINQQLRSLPNHQVAVLCAIVEASLKYRKLASVNPIGDSKDRVDSPLAKPCRLLKLPQEFQISCPAVADTDAQIDP